MRKQLTKIAFTAALGLAITFTLSCTQTADEPPPEISSSGGSSSPSSEPVWGEWAVTTPATCEAEGVETRTNNLSQTETRTISKFEWGEWTVTTPATCGTQGVETKTCPDNASPSQTKPIFRLSYDQTTQFCQTGTNAIKDLCDKATYTVTQFCQTGTKAVVKNLCGTKDYTEERYCSDGTIKEYGSMTYDGGQIYKTVEIGSQV
jgi:hypothetical protein